MSALLTDGEVEDLKRLGVSAGMKVLTGGSISTSDVIEAVKVGVHAALRAARLAEITMKHQGDASGELVWEGDEPPDEQTQADEPDEE